MSNKRKLRYRSKPSTKQRLSRKLAHREAIEAKIGAKAIRQIDREAVKLVQLRHLLSDFGVDAEELLKGNPTPERIEAIMKPIHGGRPWSEHRIMLDRYSVYIRRLGEETASIASELEAIGGEARLKKLLSTVEDATDMSADDARAIAYVLRATRVGFVVTMGPILLEMRMRINLQQEGFDRLTDDQRDWKFLAAVIESDPRKCKACLYKDALVFASRISEMANIKSRSSSSLNRSIGQSHRRSIAQPKQRERQRDAATRDCIDLMNQGLSNSQVSERSGKSAAAVRAIRYRAAQDGSLNT